MRQIEAVLLMCDKRQPLLLKLSLLYDLGFSSFECEGKS